MTYKTKSILFASLIALMVIPISSMSFADPVDFDSLEIERAESEIAYEIENLTFEEKQYRLISQVLAVQSQMRITSDTTDLAQQEQELLEELFNNGHDPETSNEATIHSVGDSDPQPRFGGNSNFYMNGKHVGCDEFNETWNFHGTVRIGFPVFSVEQSFPAELTSGSSPGCISSEWERNVYLTLTDTFDTSTGCHANIITDPQTSYSLDCQTPIEGFWVARVTADYEGQQVSGYTLVFAF